MTRAFIFGYNRQQNLILWDRAPLRCGKKQTRLTVYQDTEGTMWCWRRCGAPLAIKTGFWQFSLGLLWRWSCGPINELWNREIVHLALEAASGSVANTGLPGKLGYFEIACCRSKKLLGGWPKIGLLFIHLPAVTLFSSNLPGLCRFGEFLNLLNVQEHSFHQFKRLRCPGEQSISIIHFTQNQQSNCFSTQLGDFDYFTAEKHPNLENWAYGTW